MNGTWKGVCLLIVFGMCTAISGIHTNREPESAIHGQRLVTQHKAGTMPVALWKSDDWLEVPGQALKAGYHVNKAGEFVHAAK